MKHCKRGKHGNTYKNGAPITILVKHVKRGNFPMILYRVAKNLMWRGHSTYLNV